MPIELYIPPPRLSYNPVNGQFRKGFTPHNKGRGWDEWMSEKGKRKARKGWENLSKCRHRKRPDVVERCSKRIIAIMDDMKSIIFPNIVSAAIWIKGSNRNVCRCCQFNASEHVNMKTGNINTDHRYKGVRFYYMTDDNWWSKVEQ